MNCNCVHCSEIKRQLDRAEQREIKLKIKRLNK